MNKLDQIITDIYNNNKSYQKNYLPNLQDLFSVKLVLFSTAKYTIGNDEIYGKKYISKGCEYIILMIVNILTKKNKKEMYENIMKRISFIEHNYNIKYINSQTYDTKNYIILILSK